MQAHLIKGYLDSKGIFCQVRGEHLVGIQGEVPVTMDTLPSIWVGDGDRERARALIEQALASEAALEAEWTCGKCGESIEGQFTECWSCGATRQS